MTGGRARKRSGPTTLAALDDLVAAQGHAGVGAWAGGRWARVLELLATFNARTNLVGDASVAAVCADHLAESIALVGLLHALPSLPSTIVDVGAGAGLEALALAWSLPGTSVVALEPRRKRAAFVRLAADALGIAARLQVEEIGLDAYAAAATIRCDLVTSRAVFPPARWLVEAAGLGARHAAAHASRQTRDAFMTDAARACGWRIEGTAGVPGRDDRAVLLFGRESA